MEKINKYLDLLSLGRNIENICKNEDEKLWKEVFSAKFECLLLIYKLKEVSPSYLVKELGIAKSNIANICRTLEREKEIYRMVADDDRRVIFYGVTTKGKIKVESYLKKIDEIFERKLDKENEELLGSSLRNLLSILYLARGER